MCHVFRFGSSDTYRLVVSADVVLVYGGFRLGGREHPGKTGGGPTQEKFRHWAGDGAETWFQTWGRISVPFLRR